MSSREEENYYRLFHLISTTGKEILVTYMSEKLQGTSLQDFLENNKHIIFHFWQNKIHCCLCRGSSNSSRCQILNRKQWNILFVNNTNTCMNCINNCVCEYSAKIGIGFGVFDISLITCIILNCVTMSTQVKPHIERIRVLRNTTDHKPQKQLTNQEFEDHWQEVRSCILNIAGECSHGVKNKFQKEVESRLLVDMNPTTTNEFIRLCREVQTNNENNEQVFKKIVCDKKYAYHVCQGCQS